MQILPRIELLLQRWESTTLTTTPMPLAFNKQFYANITIKRCIQNTYIHFNLRLNLDGGVEGGFVGIFCTSQERIQQRFLVDIQNLRYQVINEKEK